MRLCDALAGLGDCVALLNKLYIPPRYPDAWAAGAAPYENYTRRDALEALECAEELVVAVEGCVGEACPSPEREG